MKPYATHLQGHQATQLSHIQEDTVPWLQQSGTRLVKTVNSAILIRQHYEVSRGDKTNDGKEMAKVVTFERKKPRILTLETERKDQGQRWTQSKEGWEGSAAPHALPTFSAFLFISKLLRADFSMAWLSPVALSFIYHVSSPCQIQSKSSGYAIPLL